MESERDDIALSAGSSGNIGTGAVASMVGGAAAGRASDGRDAARGTLAGGAAAAIGTGGASVLIRYPNDARIEPITPQTMKNRMSHPRPVQV
jgi:hypothetical protein